MAERLDFSRRALLEEEMDQPLAYEDLRRCLRDLSVVNVLFQAHRPIVRWLNRLAESGLAPGDASTTPACPLRIVDVGCGYGDLLRKIERWAARRGVAVDLLGVDLNPHAVRAAREATPASSRIAFVRGEAQSIPQAAEADIVLCSGMTHHLAEPELVCLLRWMESTARLGWFICDLHRKPVPYRLFSACMRGPWWHRFIRPDGMRSIRRSFLEEDWLRLCAAAGLACPEVEIFACRPARLCVGRLRPWAPRAAPLAAGTGARSSHTSPNQRDQASVSITLPRLLSVSSMVEPVAVARGRLGTEATYSPSVCSMLLE
jgi:SAM-dependent methyltransferase